MNDIIGNNISDQLSSKDYITNDNFEFLIFKIIWILINNTFEHHKFKEEFNIHQKNQNHIYKKTSKCTFHLVVQVCVF